MRLIDADKLMEQVREVKQVTEVSLNHGKEYCHTFLAPSHVKRLIDNAPTIEPDHPEIIHCRDCIHNANLPESGNALCVLFYGMTDQYGYCHKGERRSYATD